MMIEFADTPPSVEVPAAEYVRLLGYPRGYVLEDRAAELAALAREWYAAHGHPWIYAREAATLEMAGPSILIDGEAFTSQRLARTLERAGAHSVVLVAVGAGAEAEDEARVRWAEEKPDEFFFLDVFASTVVEQLMMAAGARLCGVVEPNGLAVLPHYSPGYPQWDIAEQPRLLGLVQATRAHALPSAIEALDSGALRPRKSQLAVFGITRHVDRVGRLGDLVPCHTCRLTPCAYRRAPYARGRAGAPAPGA